ncbi:dimethyl sulfoxide reductase anchor subunit family protein [Anaerotardibacter muris]|uniref:dimethyl sulfoxide reductase anchor subunit family protein n=1 Tax=Anaerotardibacter muris TaxID=2941505 RepID=UPI00203AAD57|nr:DmsC/YnfH family molybdoenzyme membrane anchor subunit [Anaerotardibacter muris]
MELAMHELPLACFTTLAPLGAGAFFMLALSFCFGEFTKDQLKKIDRLTIIPLLVAFVGLLASVFHLANPMHMFSVANTVGSSPLANEITAFGVFMIVAAVYWIVALAGGLKSMAARKAFAMVAGVLGLIAAIFIGCAYLLPTIPTWNNPWTPLSILGFTLFGGTLLGLLVTTCAGAGEASVKGKAGSAIFAAFTIGAVLALVSVIALWIMGSTAPDAVLRVGDLAGSMIWAFVLFIILTVVGYGVGFAAIKISPLMVFVVVGVVLAAIAIFLARLCFYALQIGVGL